jgi:hypothetical protein
MYAMMCTRPNVTLVVRLTNCFQGIPRLEHWTTFKNIMKYLKRTKDMSLIYGGCEEKLDVKGYTDASFDTDPDDSKS